MKVSGVCCSFRANRGRYDTRKNKRFGLMKKVFGRNTVVADEQPVMATNVSLAEPLSLAPARVAPLPRFGFPYPRIGGRRVPRIRPGE